MQTDRSNMIITVVKEPPWLLEGFSLLKNLAEGTKLQELTESNEKKYQLHCSSWDFVKEFYIELEENASTFFEENKEDIQYYFSCFEDTKGCLAELLYNRSIVNPEETLENYRKKTEGFSFEESIRIFGANLTEFGNCVFEENSVPITSSLEISQLILQMPITAEGKWNIQELFLNQEEHTLKVLILIETAVTVLKKSMKKINFLCEEFYRYWNNFLEHTDFTIYLKENLGIDLQNYLHDDFPNGQMRPFLIQQTDVACLRIGEDSSDSFFFLIGILFNEIFMPHTMKADQNPDVIFQALRCLSDKSKFDILTYIKKDWAYGSQIAKHMNLSTATISHHMSILLEHGLVEIKTKKDENRIYYHQNQKKLKEVLGYYETLF